MSDFLKFKKDVRPGELLTEIDKDFAKYIATTQLGGLSKGVPKILATTLTLRAIDHYSYKSALANAYTAGGQRHLYGVAYFILYRMEIARARNYAVTTAIKGGFDYLFFYDDDTIEAERLIGRLLEHMKEFNAISGGYYIRGYPFNPMIFQWINREKYMMRLVKWRSLKKLIDKDGIIRRNIAAIGNGCTLYRVDDFKKVPYPWFQTGPTYSEDVYWFIQAYKHIKDYKVGMDYNAGCGHILDPLYVHPNNVHILRRMYRMLGHKE